MEKRTSVHPHKPHASSQPSRFSYARRNSDAVATCTSRTTTELHATGPFQTQNQTYQIQ